MELRRTGTPARRELTDGQECPSYITYENLWPGAYPLPPQLHRATVPTAIIMNTIQCLMWSLPKNGNRSRGNPCRVSRPIMARPLQVEYPDAHDHVMSRGNPLRPSSGSKLVQGQRPKTRFLPPASTKPEPRATAMRLAPRTTGSARCPWTALRRRRPGEIETAERRTRGTCPWVLKTTCGSSTGRAGKCEATNAGRSRKTCGRFWNVWDSTANPGSTACRTSAAHFHRAAGGVSLLADAAARAGRRWFHGVARCRQAFA